MVGFCHGGNMPASHVVLVDVVDVCGPDGYAHSDADAYPVQCGLLVNNGWPACTTASLRLRYIQYKFTSCPHYHHHQRQLEDF